MIDPTGELDVEEKKLLTEALSDGDVQVGPSQEYVAELRRRSLSVATHREVVRGNRAAGSFWDRFQRAPRQFFSLQPGS